MFSVGVHVKLIVEEVNTELLVSSVVLLEYMVMIGTVNGLVRVDLNLGRLEGVILRDCHKHLELITLIRTVH